MNHHSIQYEKIDIATLSYTKIKELITFHNTWYKTHRTPEHWIWQYKSYDPHKAVFTTARDNHTLIGTQAMMPVYMMIGNKRVLTAKSENTLLLPQYRGHGIMETLYAFAIKACQQIGYEFIWGFTPAKKAFQKFGFSVMPVPYILTKPGFNLPKSLIKRLNYQTPVWRRLLSIGHYSLLYLKQMNDLIIPTIDQTNNYIILKQPVLSTKIRNLKTQLILNHPSMITPYMDERFIHWRMRNHPFLKYDAYQILTNNSLIAYAMTVLSHDMLSISDFGSLDAHALRLLLNTIIKDHRKNVGQFTILLNPAYLEKLNQLTVFKNAKFKMSSLDYLVTKDLTGHWQTIISQPDNWNLSGIWTEGFTM